MFFGYSVRSPHRTTKPSRGWLRVVVRKPRLVLSEYRATRNKVTATPRSYCRGCIPRHRDSGWPRAPQGTQGTRNRPKSAGSSHEWSWLSLLRPRDASVEFAWGQRRCVRDPAFTSPKEPCSQRASRSGTVLPTRTVDDCGRPRRSNCSCGPFGGRALPCLRAARRRCFDEHDDPAADGALRADGTRDFKK